MKIGCVTRHVYPTAQEIRVAKFAASLTQAGHEFLVLCPGEPGQTWSDHFVHGGIQRCVPPRWMGRVGKRLFSPLPISLLWLMWLRAKFKAKSLDLVIVRDLRLALPVILAARLCGIKAILDLGEHYPGMMEIIGKQKFSHYIIRNDRLIRWLERISVRMADAVWVVVEENMRRLKPYAKQIQVINNYPISDGNSLGKVCAHRAWSPTGEPVKLVSLGLIDSIRGLDLAIKAFEIVDRDLGNVQFVIYGDGEFRLTLEQMVEARCLKDKVVFGGWISSEDVKYELMADGDVGLILHKVCDLTNHTIPNKLFDYMSVGLPIVATHLDPVEKIIKQEDCGVCVDEDAVEIALALIKMILEVSRRKQMGLNGQNAIMNCYRWGTEALKISSEITRLTICL